MQQANQDKVDKYQELRTKAKELYDSFEKVRCPALGNELVHFTAEGFNHLLYKPKKKPRDKRVQIMKFELLRKTKLLLETTTTFQEYEETFQYVKVKRHKKTRHENVAVKSWGFVAIIDGFRLKVVVRKFGNSKYEFYSVIPAWVTRQYRDIKLIENSKGLNDEDEKEALKNTASFSDVL